MKEHEKHQKHQRGGMLLYGQIRCRAEKARKKHQKHENHTALVRDVASIYEQSIIGGEVDVYFEGADVVLCSGTYLKGMRNIGCEGGGGLLCDA